MTLLENTRRLLDRQLETGKSLRQIARECGDGVEYDWLKRFNVGDIADPSVNRIQVLHDCLKSLKAEAQA